MLTLLFRYIAFDVMIHPLNMWPSRLSDGKLSFLNYEDLINSVLGIRHKNIEHVIYKYFSVQYKMIVIPHIHVTEQFISYQTMCNIKASIV